MSKNKNIRKPHGKIINMDMGEPVIVNGIRISAQGITLLDKGNELRPISASLESWRERGNIEKPLKTTTHIPLDPGTLNLNLVDELRKYDKLFVIDTSTDDRETVSVCAVILCCIQKNGDDLTIDYALVHCLEFRNLKRKLAEKVACKKVIELLQNNKDYKNELKIGFVIDHSLGDLTDFNSREKPIYGDFCLPENITLMYASADNKNVSILNELILLADKKGKELREYIQCGYMSDVDLLECDSELYTHFRLWYKK